MAGSISATPRNQLLGLLADGISGAADWASQDNPPVRGLLGLLGVPAVANTLNEMSYGGALGTGSGMTWKPKADTADAAMAVAPFVKPAAQGVQATAKFAAPALGDALDSYATRAGLQLNAINPTDFGLPVNKDGTVTLLHGTNKEAAKNIIATGRLKSAGEPDVYLTTSPNAGYGDGTVVKVNVDPKKLFIDDEFPDGRFDFRLPAINGQAAIKKPGLLGDVEQQISKTERIPVADSFFQATGVPPAKMFADVEKLRLKHPQDFQTTDDLRNHLIGAYGGEPNFISQATDPRYTLTTTPAGTNQIPTGQPYRAAVTDLRGVNGGNYQVISAFPMTDEQLATKKLLKKK